MIRIQYKKSQSSKIRKKTRSKAIIRKKIIGTRERPRLSVFRSHQHIYAQLIDDDLQKTIFQISTLKEKTKDSPCQKAQKVGEQIAKKAKEKGIQRVVFDRNGHVYHGRVKAVAHGARSAGLIF